MPETNQVAETQAVHELTKESKKEGVREIFTPSGSANGEGNQAPI
jgi:hypothetical protein